MDLITPRNVKTARTLLGWTQADLGEHAGLSDITVRLFEGGQRATDKTIQAIGDTLESAGIKLSQKGKIFNLAQDTGVKIAHPVKPLK